MHPRTAARLTHVVSWVLILYALVWASAAYPPVDAPARFLLDVLAWPVGDGRPDWDANLIWMSSIGAGLLMALGVVFLGIVTPAVRAGNRRVVRVVIGAMLAWFVLDSAGSVAAGFAPNAVLNLITLVPIMLPLVLVRFDDG